MPSSRAVFPGSPSVLDDDFLFVPGTLGKLLLSVATSRSLNLTVGSPSVGSPSSLSLTCQVRLM